MSPQEIWALVDRRQELLRQSWEMVCTPPPSGEQAGYAFDEAHAELEREIAEIEKQLLGVGVGEPEDSKP